MNSFPIYLNQADLRRLQTLHQAIAPGPKPDQEQRLALESLLNRASRANLDTALENRIGFHDRVALVSPVDSRDFFNLQIVMPAEADPDEDRISALLPVSLAVLGRRCGELVTWDGPQGRREMRIISVNKAEEIAA